MDPIKDSFNRVKKDIIELKAELNTLKENMLELCEILQEINTKISKINEKSIPAQLNSQQTNQNEIPAHNLLYRPYKLQNTPFSIGNEGVPADRQTNQQTDRQTKISQNTIEDAAQALKTLDLLKKEIKQKFKTLTDQEWLVFSTIYQFDEEEGHSNYKILAEKLKLTESSIRDYVARLIKKGIPVDKTKINNKEVRLNVSKNLKEIASLSALITLRDL